MNKYEKVFFAVRAVFIVLLVIVLTVLLCAQSHKKQYMVAEWHSYTVVEGDTLFAIAQRVTPSAVDWRTTVDKIQKENGITPTIYPGQVISVPVWEEVER